jgi:hypothetical protein
MSADYEVPVTTVSAADGTELRVVRHYTDGIVMLDPAKIVVYDPDGSVVAETPYFRHVVVHPTSDGRLNLFGLGIPGAFFFHKGWTLTDRSLVPLPPLRGHVHAILASLRAHWLAYPCCVLPLVLGMASFLSNARAAGSWCVGPGGWGIGALVWFFLLLMYGSLSPLLILHLSLLASLPLARNGGEVVLIVCVFGGGGLLLRLLVFYLCGMAWLIDRKVRWDAADGMDNSARGDNSPTPGGALDL